MAKFVSLRCRAPPLWARALGFCFTVECSFPFIMYPVYRPHFRLSDISDVRYLARVEPHNAATPPTRIFPLWVNEQLCCAAMEQFSISGMEHFAAASNLTACLSVKCVSCMQIDCAPSRAQYDQKSIPLGDVHLLRIPRILHDTIEQSCLLLRDTMDCRSSPW